MELLCGVDEAGRGPLAGPVTAAAVILSNGFPRHTLFDSKLLTADERERITAELLSTSQAYAVGWCWPAEIDRINIHNAALLAMQRAVMELNLEPTRVFVDGKHAPALPYPTVTVVKGDSFVPEIQAASILAKTIRDRWMIRYSWIEQEYLFDKHKGYPTREHRERCRRYGLSPIHRRSFRIDTGDNNR